MKQLQIATFDNIMGDNQTECNEFLKTIGNDVFAVTPLYNTILGGVVYIVQYYI